MKPRLIPAWNQQSQGFSLIELAVTILIVGILSSISLAVWLKYIELERVRLITQKSLAWIEDVKKQAIQNDIPCEIEIDNKNNTLDIPIQAANSELYRCTQLPSIRPFVISDNIENVPSLVLCSRTLASGDNATDSLSDLFSSTECGSTSTTNAKTIFSPRGTLTDSLLIKASIANGQYERCITLLHPNSIIRTGLVKNDQCDFTNAY